MTTVHTTKRLAELRQLMQERSIDVYVVPSEDSHQSEYIAASDARRAFISGFNGSAGTAIITADKAALSTDGRYFNQASYQLDENWELLKQGQEKVLSWQEWTAKATAGGKTAGVDPDLIPAMEAKRLDEKIKHEGGKQLKAVPENLVDIVWGSQRPPRPHEPIKVLDVKFAGKPYDEKLEELREKLREKQSPGFVVSMLDEIAWLLNLRGNDIPYNPVFFAYAFITLDSAVLYVDSSQLDQSSRSQLAKYVTVKPYGDIFGDLEETASKYVESLGAASESANQKKRDKFLAGKRIAWSLKEALGGIDGVDEILSPVADAKSKKNPTELAGMRAGHVRDGAAISQYFAWLERELLEGRSVDEVQGADKLLEIRKEMAMFVGLSFPTISSAGANAAVIHYQPVKETCAQIKPDEIYLCDCGVQCLDSTTDTTRTLHFGKPSMAEKRGYTLVLKGHIALDMAVFPKGTSGMSLDVLARQYLWTEDQYNVPHGIGHGIGSYLNVHEGPISISARPGSAEVALSEGNVLSNEPGYYEDGKFGIRIENAVLVVPTGKAVKGGEKPFYRFEKVTMVPMCRNLIDMDLMEERDVKWVDDYHREVRQKLASILQPRAAHDDDEAKLAWDWVLKETEPLRSQC